MLQIPALSIRYRTTYHAYLSYTSAQRNGNKHLIYTHTNMSFALHIINLIDKSNVTCMYHIVYLNSYVSD